MWPQYLACAGLGYLLGSFPTGYLVGRWHGLDIRQHGSGVTGATNVTRMLGKKAGALVFLADAVKGWLSVFAAHAVAGSAFADVLAGFFCILGHNFPVWLGFRGGKGISTSAGVMLGLMPGALAVSAIVWAAAYFGLRYVSLASLLAAAALPLSVGLLWRAGHADEALFWFALAATALAFWRHRSNIQRLLHGTEPRMGGKRVPQG